MKDRFKHRRTVVGTLTGANDPEEERNNLELLKKYRRLSEIVEDPAETDDFPEPKFPKWKKPPEKPVETIKHVRNPVRKYLIGNPVQSDNKHVAYFQKFINQLKEYPQIFNLFLNMSLKRDILRQRKTKSLEYYLKYIHPSNAEKYQKVPQIKYIRQASPHNYSASHESDDSLLYSNVSRLSQRDVSQRKADKTQESTIKSSFLEESSMNTSDDSSSKQGSRQSQSNNKTRRLRKMAHVNKQVLDRQDKTLQHLFLKIGKQSPFTAIRTAKVSGNQLFMHLSDRYPAQIIEIMMGYIGFKDINREVNFETYCSDLDRIILRTDRHLRLCFDVFDFNKDQYIDYEDTYEAIRLRTNDYYDHDLVKIRTMFKMKKNKKIPTKYGTSKKRKRRPSTYSKNTSDGGSEDEVKKKKIPHYHPDKPEAITFEDFQKIEFPAGKPQILNDFLLYTCNYSPYDAAGLVVSEYVSRRNSQEVVEEMTLNVESLQKALQDPNFEYYNDLQQMMQLYKYEEAEMLFQKFAQLQCQSMKNIRVITLKSMLRAFVTFKQPKFLGIESQYISIRVYKIFAERNYVDVTKAQMLRTLQPLLKGDK